MDTSKDTFLLKDYVRLYSGESRYKADPFIQENARKIEEILKNTKLSKKLNTLSQGEQLFANRYLPSSTKKDNNFVCFKLIHCSQGIIGIGVIGTKIYITDMMDEKDQGKSFETPYVSRLRNPMFVLKTILPIGNDTFFVVVNSKERTFGGPFLHRLHLVNVREKTCITIPEGIGKNTQLIHYNEYEGIQVDGSKILIEGEFVKNIYEYLSECDDTHDAAESRSYRGPSFFRKCEIDIKTGKLQLVK